MLIDVSTASLFPAFSVRFFFFCSALTFLNYNFALLYEVLHNFNFLSACTSIQSFIHPILTMKLFILYLNKFEKKIFALTAQLFFRKRKIEEDSGGCVNVGQRLHRGQTSEAFFDLFSRI